MIYNNFLNDIEFESFDNHQLVNIYQNGLLFQRGRALFEIARRSAREESLLKIAKDEIVREENVVSKTVGVISISCLGIAGLFAGNTDETKTVAMEIISSYPEAYKSNLIEFLQSLEYLS
jgi:hypothetical protein